MVYSAKQKFVTICWSKCSCAVTQMSQTEMRWCIVTAVGGQCGRYNGFRAIQLAHSKSFNGLNARAYVNIAAWFSHLLQLCITRGDDRYLEQDNALCHGDRIIEECIVQDSFRWNNVNDLDTTPELRSFWDSVQCRLFWRERVSVSHSDQGLC